MEEIDQPEGNLLKELFMCKRAVSIVIVVAMTILLSLGSAFSNTSSSNESDFDLALEQITLELDDISEEYKLLFLTDNHANFDDRENLGWFGTKESRTFYDENNVASEDNLQNWIEYANDGGMDAIVFGGDILDIYTDINADQMYLLLSELEIPYVYTYGNHDSYVPWNNQFKDYAENFLRLFPNENCEFSCLDMGEFYLVAIRDYAQDGTANISEEALESFREIYNEGKAIILCMHVPISANGLSELVTEQWGGLFKNYYTEDGTVVFESLLLGEECGYSVNTETLKFLDLILAENSPVKLILAGHVHFSWIGQLKNGTVQYVGAGAFDNTGAVISIRPAQ